MAMQHDQVVRQLMADRDKLYAYVWSIVRDDHTADDIVQEVAILAIDKREEIADATHLPAWVRTAARHRALYHMRQSARRPAVVDAEVLDLMESEWKAIDASPSSAMTSALRRCIDRLSPYARQLIDLRYVTGLKPAAIADRVGRNVNSVYVAMTRTHKQLGDCVKRSLAGEGEGDD